MIRPRVTPSDALLLFVTEPQQLDAVFEFGTETIGPSTIPARLGDDDEVERRDCCAASTYDPCVDDCDCAPCENERALDDDADAYFDREM